MKKYFTFVILLTAGLCISVNAQWVKFDSLVITGIKQIYNIEFDKADRTFNKLIADYPNHPAGKFFMAMIDWWKILLDTDSEQRDDIFFKKIDNVIEQCDAILDKNPDDVDAIFFKGGAIGFRGRLNSIRENWLSAADDGREALPLIEHAAEVDPKNIDVQLGFGIYNYYAAVLPEKYPIVKPFMLFLPWGDKELGLKQLKDVANNGKYTKYESQYFLMTLYYRFESKVDSSEKYALMLNKEFPNNPIFERWFARIIFKKGNLASADSIYKDILWKADNKYPGYSTFRNRREANYYLGYHLRNEGKYDSAMVYLNRSMDYSLKMHEDRESGFLINATLYLGMIKENKREYAAAKMYYEKVLDMREFGNSHGLAESYLERIEQTEKKMRN